MFYLKWTFIGMLVGLLLVSVFLPPFHKDLDIPTPGEKHIFHTPHGCVRFKTKSVPCTDDATSLNLLASQHK